MQDRINRRLLLAMVVLVASALPTMAMAQSGAPHAARVAGGYARAVLVQQADIYVNPAHPRLISHDQRWTDTAGTVMREVLAGPHGGRTERYARLLSGGLIYATRTTDGGNVWTTQVIRPPKVQLARIARQYIGFRNTAEVKQYYLHLERVAVEKPRLVHVHGQAMIRYAYKVSEYNKSQWITYLDARTGLPLEQSSAALLLRYHTYLLPPGRLPADFFAQPHAPPHRHGRTTPRH